MKFKSLISTVLVIVLLFTASVSAFAQTSFSFRFDDKHEKLLSDYPHYAALMDEELSSTPMPGVEKTKMGENEYCYNMVPQGLCFAEDYMLITAYDYTKEYNSVIYVISNDDVYNRELLSVLVLPDKNHAGGITYDGEYVYIARSTDEALGVIRFADIREAAKNDVSNIDYFNKIDCGCTASSVSFYDEKIWVGVFKENGLSELHGFVLNSDNDKLSLEKTDKMYLPAKSQGVAFFEENEKTYLAVSSSYGRNNKAKLYVFEMTQKEDRLSQSFCKQYTMPPLMEEPAVYDGNLYIISEGAATEYTSTNCRNTDAPLDRVAATSTKKLISLAGDIDIFTSIINRITVFVCEMLIETEYKFQKFANMFS